ncbi:unnamed protein product [Candidula unifasciata]|uniref:FAD dependent oxidoreductase domain-containing protein n=1 Tax=Candidula unifasciata TaxID=100452 RepID=A0A8S3ZV72_9EUPU|nr:unnamed protein product [Candidula unifasciata]
MSVSTSPKVVVIGAGVNGLACAVCIQKCCPEAQVEIVAENWSPNTTSEISAGFWGPYVVGDTDPEVIKKHSSVTHEYLLQLAHSPLAGDVGVQTISGYYLYYDVEQENEIIKSATDGYRKLTPPELARFPMAKSGYFHTTVQVDVTPYLQWLTKRFTEAGGRVHKRKVFSLSEFAGQCDLVINCSGLGAGDLLKDEQVFPTRGQVWRVHAPWIKHFYLFKPQPGQEDIYILPGVKYTVVGGTGQVADWRTQIDEQDSVDIWRRAQNLLPSLARATPVKVQAGLRPTRTTLRLETELIKLDGKQLKVVHNYGHGGCGVTLHWGCAVEATKLALELLNHSTRPIQHIRSRI